MKSEYFCHVINLQEMLSFCNLSLPFFRPRGSDGALPLPQNVISCLMINVGCVKYYIEKLRVFFTELSPYPSISSFNLFIIYVLTVTYHSNSPISSHYLAILTPLHPTVTLYYCRVLATVVAWWEAVIATRIASVLLLYHHNTIHCLLPSACMHVYEGWNCFIQCFVVMERKGRVFYCSIETEDGGVKGEDG